MYYKLYERNIIYKKKLRLNVLERLQLKIKSKSTNFIIHHRSPKKQA